ncbi:MAG: BspA family leucine-rich repeat surface protein, partial [Prevotella sp.]|nr:BspA family leucine-rich repeat surface protein [Prevotella sp.]
KGCKKLKGAVEYDANATDAAMANPTTGYFTKIDISAVENVNAEDVSPNKQGIYNLQGMRLNQSWETLQKGLYIVNGKKRMKE